ncbi:MAG TPA: nuclear transport factor 2 family protein [Devosia sp.]
MTIEAENMDVVRRLIAAIEVFDADTAAALYHPEVVQTEHPNAIYPKGQVRSAEMMLRDLPRGRQVLRSQRYPIDAIFAGGDRVAVETRWEGILDVPLGKRQPGDALVAHICMVFTLRDGRVISQNNYDCYEGMATKVD